MNKPDAEDIRIAREMQQERKRDKALDRMLKAAEAHADKQAVSQGLADAGIM